MDLSVLFLGTAGSVPTVQRAPASILVRRGGERVLIDCGEGTQRQLLRSVGLPDVEHVFLTHYHADHFLGLPGMLKTFAMRGREVPLNVYGPPGLKGLMGDLRRIFGRLTYEIRLRELRPSEAVDMAGWRIGAYAAVHRLEALGYALVEDGRPGRTLVFTGDTEPCEATVAVAQGADLLVHDGTFADEEAERAAHTGHSTARQAAEVAARAGVSLLALTHLSSRYFAPAIEKEAREAFDHTVVPRDFDLIEVPYAERGEPQLVPWKEWRERKTEPAAPVPQAP